MRISDVKRSVCLANKLGFFVSSLLITVLATYIYSPTIGTNADGSDINVQATVNPVISLLLNVDELDISMLPSSTGAFDSGILTATVGTNSTGGYELYFSSIDNNTDMVSTNENIQNVVSSNFSGTVTASTMAANTWGYSIDDINYSSIPALSSQLALKNLDHFPTSEERITAIYIGIKIDNTLPAGLYTKDVIFTTLAHATPEPPFSGITRMQDMTAEVCTAEDEDVTTTLRDSRDANSYTVFRGKDGRCWMSENLRLIDTRITKEDSDITADYFDVPGNNWAQSNNSTEKYTNPYAYDNEDDELGVYYNYAAASAGTIYNTSNSAEATESICPKGWKMPSQAEFQTLLNAYNITSGKEGMSTIMSEPLNFGYLGNVAYNRIPVSTTYTDGGWWSTTTMGSTNRKNLIIRSSGYYIGTDTSIPRISGYNLRCVSRND